MTLDDTQLIQLSKEGFIAGPDEDEESFLKRVDYCKNLKNHLFDEFGNELAPLRSEEEDQEAFLEESFSLTEPLFDVKPDWVPLFFSNYKLLPWHGGCAWIFQKEETTPWASLLQLRKEFRKKKSLLGLYKREELIAHELAHTCRMTFNEPLFEEIIAYQCQGRSWQRWLGPLIQKRIEAVLFVLLLLTLFFIDFALLASGQLEIFQSFQWLKIFPALLLTYALFRLYNKRRLFHSLKEKLTQLFNSQIAQAILFRLTDNEIIHLSKQTPEDILHFAEKQKETSPRWRQLYAYIRQS